MVGFSEAVKRGFLRWMDFYGRSSRSEYWFWKLFTITVYIVAGILDYKISHMTTAKVSANNFESWQEGPIFLSLTMGVFAIPSITVAIRRLHDINKNGFTVFFMMLPIIGWIMLLVWYCSKGDTDTNKYGANPMVSVPDVKVDLKESIKSGFRKAFTFSGRASRMEYWSFQAAFYLLTNVVMLALVKLIPNPTVGLVLLFAPVVLFFIPFISIGVRRMHDIDRKGWWLFLHFFVVVGSIILFVWTCRKGTKGPNRFGADPLNEPDFS